MKRLPPCPFCKSENNPVVVEVLTLYFKLATPKKDRAKYANDTYRVECYGGCGAKTADFNSEFEAIRAWSER